MNELIVTMRDAREAGLCVRGAKAWFDQKGLDFRGFVKHGMPASQAEALNDAFAARALQHARKRAGEEQ